MVALFKPIFTETDGRVRTKIVLSYILLILFNFAAWITAYSVFKNYPKLMMLCMIAYGFGLRHAVDADHIAAIDSVTRKFIQQKKIQTGTGFFFSLGHSSVVIIMAFLVALGTLYMKEHIAEFQRIGSFIGSIVSSTFLLALGLINLMIFADTYKSFVMLRKHRFTDNDDTIRFIEQKGIMTRIFRPFLKLVTKSWHMYIIGFLFGLGFDTATEISLLGISASQAVQGLPIWIIMIFPALFMAGMCLIDTTDGILMLGVYGWAFVDPAKKLFYNMTITFISFLVAFFIGGIEGLCVIAEKFNLQDGFWGYVTNLNENLGNMGYYIIGIFIISWILSSVIYNLFVKKKPVAPGNS